MATFTAAAAAANKARYQPLGSNSVCAVTGFVDVGANPAPGDVYQLCRVPAGATVIGGALYSGDLDTNATETLDIDVGWQFNGTDAADPDGFGNLGVQGTDTVAGVKPEAGYNFQFGGVLITEGPKTFARDTVIAATCVAAAATFAAGRLSCVVYYINQNS